MAVDPRDAELYGEELVQDVQRWAAPVVDQRVGHLEHQLADMRTQIAQERVQAALDADPELRDRWRQLNTDPKFLSWLEEVDGLSNEKRLVLLGRAYRLGHSSRVAAFFRAFIAERQAPVRQRTEARLPFEGGRPKPRTTYTDLDDRRKRWSRSEIAAFYDDCRRGRYDGREGERGRIEAEIIRAGASGRIIDPLLQNLK